MKIKELKAIFENDDKLILLLTEFTPTNLTPISVWELAYYKKSSDGTYNAINTEYFPDSMSSTAKSAFNIRLNCSNPLHESAMGYSLNQLLNKK